MARLIVIKQKHFRFLKKNPTSGDAPICVCHLSLRVIVRFLGDTPVSPKGGFKYTYILISILIRSILISILMSYTLGVAFYHLTFCNVNCSQN